ncbi:hypothetical protein OUZ56_001456 [Daphnia magna]|uniref:Uncharacterized protein n=1 Tax=Daphnia magna TaxID=35525 RepID=A0ABR0A2T2_9CRUS|nr:hypothetical protein OUZ56_001456 [Daphnia magna]
MGITLQALRLSPCVTDKISLVSLDPLILCTEIKNEMRYPNKMANLKVVKTGVVKMARMAWIVSAVEDVEKLKATMRDIVKGTHRPFIL